MLPYIFPGMPAHRSPVATPSLFLQLVQHDKKSAMRVSYLLLHVLVEIVPRTRHLVVDTQILKSRVLTPTPHLKEERKKWVEVRNIT